MDVACADFMGVIRWHDDVRPRVPPSGRLHQVLLPQRIYIAPKQVRLISSDIARNHLICEAFRSHSETIASQVNAFSLGHGDETMPGLISRLHVALRHCAWIHGAALTSLGEVQNRLRG